MCVSFLSFSPARFLVPWQPFQRRWYRDHRRRLLSELPGLLPDNGVYALWQRCIRDIYDTLGYDEKILLQRSTMAPRHGAGVALGVERSARVEGQAAVRCTRSSSTASSVNHWPVYDCSVKRLDKRGSKQVIGIDTTHTQGHVVTFLVR